MANTPNPPATLNSIKKYIFTFKKNSTTRRLLPVHDLTATVDPDIPSIARGTMFPPHPWIFRLVFKSNEGVEVSMVGIIIQRGSVDEGGREHGWIDGGWNEVAIQYTVLLVKASAPMQEEYMDRWDSTAPMAAGGGGHPLSSLRQSGFIYLSVPGTKSP